MSDRNNLRTAKLTTVVDRYLLDLKLRNYSERTIDGETSVLNRFAAWCEERGASLVAELNDEVVNGYRRYLYHYRHPLTGRPLQSSTQAKRLVSLRTFCRWLAKHGVIDHDPTLNLEIPKQSKRRLADVLSLAEVNALLAVPEIDKPLGVRDRAILETFYSTAIRASELGNLDLADISADRKLVHIRSGKGGKDRLVPIGSQALAWIDKYVSDVRPLLVNDKSGNRLFIGERGKPLSRVMLALIVRQAMQSAGIYKRGACHLLRHTAATLMLENGADLRSLQVYLGHERLDTTQIYTHLSLDRLKDVHDQTHPTGDEKLKEYQAKRRSTDEPDGKPDVDDQ